MTSGSGSVMVSWRPPGSPNGVIKKYTVFRREVMNGEEVEVKESSVLSGPNYLELTGLEWNRRYDIWVKAATDVGYGSSSIITSIILGRIGEKRTEKEIEICTSNPIKESRPEIIQYLLEPLPTEMESNVMAADAELRDMNLYDCFIRGGHDSREAEDGIFWCFSIVGRRIQSSLCLRSLPARFFFLPALVIDVACARKAAGRTDVRREKRN